MRDFIWRADDLLLRANRSASASNSNSRGSGGREPHGPPPKPESLAMARLAGFVAEAGGQDSAKKLQICEELRSFLRTTFGLSDDQFHRSLIAGTALTGLDPLVEVLKPYCLRELPAQDLVMQIAWRIATAAGEPSPPQRHILEELNRRLCGGRYDVAEMLSDDGTDLGDFGDPSIAAGSPPPDEANDSQPDGLTANMAAVARLMGFVAKADGRVSPKEIHCVELLLLSGLKADLWTGDPVPREAFIKFFDDGKRTPDLGPTLAELRRACGEDHKLRSAVLIPVFQIAAADGHIGNEEAAIIGDVEQTLFGFRGSLTDKIEETNAGSPYAVLGLTPPCTRDEARKAYRKKAAEYHPDTLRHQKIPEEMRAFAEQRFKAVNEAYEKIEGDLG